MVIFVCLFSDVHGNLTKKPQNALVLRGKDAFLNCSSDLAPTDGKNPVGWDYDLGIIFSLPCTPHSKAFVATAPDSTTDCNIRAVGSSQHGISGVYRCQDSNGDKAVAVVIVLGE